MTSLTAVLSYFDVLLRGAILAAQAVAIGGIAFGFVVLVPAAWTDPALRPQLPSALRMSAWAALGVAAGQCFSLFVLIGSLSDTQRWPATEVLGISYGRASMVHILGSLGVAATCGILARRPTSTAAWIGTLGCAEVVVGAGAYTSHASARLDGRGLLLWVDAIHQLAADVWIGGLIHLLAAIRRARGLLPVSVLKRFSPMALGAVAGLVVTGLAFSFYYIGGASPLYGTSYGAMLVSKVLVFGGLLALGGMTFLSTRLLGNASATPSRVCWFLEAEVGLGITVLFIAASLTSLPPAADVPATERASKSEIAEQFAPQWPRLTSPTREELPVSDDPLSTRSQEDIAWSEYNHHVAGIFVLAIGLLAVLERTGRAPWARHWPLLFIGLAAFLFARDDHEAWPFGPLGFSRGLPSAPSSSATSSWCWCSVSGSSNGSCTPAACAPPAPRWSSRCWRPWAPGCSSRTRSVSKTSRRCTSWRLPTYRRASSDVAWDERVGSSCGCRRRTIARWVASGRWRWF